MSQSKPKGKRTQTRRSPWPVILVIGGVLLVAGVIAASLLNKSPQVQVDESGGPGTPALTITNIEKSPEAQVDGLKVDFGAMQLGTGLASLQLTLRNSGDKTLQFSQAPYIQLADGC